MGSVEVLSESGVLDGHSELLGVVVDVVHQGVHVAELHRGVVELFVTALSRRLVNL